MQMDAANDGGMMNANWNNQQIIAFFHN